MPTSIPTLDARTAETPQFAHDIAAAYAEFGFVIIENHGIDKALIDQCLDCFHRQREELPKTIQALVDEMPVDPVVFDDDEAELLVSRGDFLRETRSLGIACVESGD